MSRKQKLPFLALYYDKVVLVASIAVFAGAVVALNSGVSSAKEDADATMAKVRSMKPKNPVLEKASMAEFEEAMGEAEEPFMLGTNATFLVAAERVACIKCGQPILLKDDICRYCGATQPSDVVGEDWDTDGDGMPDVWEKKYGLNHVDPHDADSDADSDNFTNLEEFKAGTDPRNPASHPPRFMFLKVAEIEATPFPYLLRGKSKEPNGGYKFQINDARKQSHYIRKGEKLPGTDFTLSSYETRREMVQRPGLPPQEQDVFYLTFTHGEDSVELKENGPAVSSAFEVTLVCSKDSSGASWHVKRLESFTMDGEKFTLVSVNPRQRSAVLRREKTGENIDVPDK